VVVISLKFLLIIFLIIADQRLVTLQCVTTSTQTERQKEIYTDTGRHRKTETDRQAHTDIRGAFKKFCKSIC